MDSHVTAAARAEEAPAASAAGKAAAAAEARKAAPGAATALAIACLANFVPNYAQYQASPLGTELMEMLAINESQYSLLFTAPMIPAIFLSVVGGLLIDKLGPKRVVGVALCVTCAGCVLRVFAQSYALMMVGTMLTGLTACFLTSGASKILAGYYGPEGVGSKMGIFTAASTLGMTVALATTAFLGSVTVAFTVSAVLSAVACALWILVLKDPPADEGAGEAAVGAPTISQCLKVVLRSRNVWMVSLSLAFILAANVVVGSFAPTALAANGISSEASGIITSCYTLGNLAGCFTAPSLAKKLGGRRKPVLLAYAVLAAVGVAFGWRLGNAVVAAVCMFLTGNFVGGIIPMCYAMPVTFPEVGATYAGTAGGVLTTVQVLGAILLPSYVFTPLAAGEYSVIFLFGGASMLVAAVFLALIRLDE